jgi:hypothetical protein
MRTIERPHNLLVLTLGAGQKQTLERPTFDNNGSAKQFV